MHFALALLVGCQVTEAPESFEIDEDYSVGIDLLENGVSFRFGYKNVGSVLQTNPSPFSNNQAASTVTTYLLVDWQRDGTSVSWTETACALESNEVFGTTTSYPDAFVAAVGTKSRTAVLTEEVTGATLIAGPWVDVLGTSVTEDEPLPEDADAPDVVDEDDDGHPGVTVHVTQSVLGEGDVYVAQRLTQRLDGTIVAPDRIEGFVQLGREQSILGATAGWLEMPVAEEPDPDPSHSYFILQGIASDATCEDVLADRDDLFAQ